MQDKKTVRELRIWICDDSSCTCGGDAYIMSYQDIVDVGLPICSEGTEMVQLSGFGHELESDTVDIELANYIADRDGQEE
jgi:hypothetical protein